MSSCCLADPVRASLCRALHRRFPLQHPHRRRYELQRWHRLWISRLFLLLQDHLAGGHATLTCRSKPQIDLSHLSECARRLRLTREIPSRQINCRCYLDCMPTWCSPALQDRPRSIA
eukprot:837301-Rhodomonas_salina.1